jgi:hypothetical protein
LLLVTISELCSVDAGDRICATGGSATVIGLDLDADSDSRWDGDVIVPSSVFFPSLAATLEVTRIGRFESSRKPIKHITIPRHVQILCSSCFSYRNSLSLISFESDSELARIEAGAFNSTSLLSVVVPENTSFIAGDPFRYNCVHTAGRHRRGIQ